MATMPILPTELIDNVFSWLELPQDASSLQACSLVCTAWLPIAREHLFATLRTQEGQANGTRSLSDLVRILEQGSGLRHAIQRLVIEGFLSNSKLPFNDLAIILPQLPRLHHVSLHNVRIPAIPDIDLFETRTCSLRSLTLNNVGFYLDNPVNIFRLLHAFDSIDELTIERIWFRYAYGAPREAIVTTLPIPSHLSAKSLTLHGADDRTELLLIALLQTRVPACLQHLHISFYDFTPLVPSVAAFLASSACRVQHLAFDFSRCFPYAFWSDKRGLLLARTAIEQVLRSCMPNLHSVRIFELHTGNVPAEAEAFWDMCGAVLCVLPLGVEEVQVCVVNEQFGFDIEALLRALEKYDTLERISFRGVGESKRGELQSIAKDVHMGTKITFIK